MLLKSKVTGILDFDDLQAITGYVRPGDIERKLSEQGIKVFRGKKGPWTTLDLINQAGGMHSGNEEHYNPEII